MMLQFFVACQVVELLIFGYSLYREEFELDKENLAMIGFMVLLGPVGLFGIFTALIFDQRQTKFRQNCNLIMTRWERIARDGHNARIWSWYHNGEYQEERYNLLREHIKDLSDKELDTLSRASKGTFELPECVKDAVIDELMLRNILKHGQD